MFCFFFPFLFSGVWATQVIPKGKRFGPFVGEKKKRSQVTSNVYMWEVGYKSLRLLLYLQSFLRASGGHIVPGVKRARGTFTVKSTTSKESV